MTYPKAEKVLTFGFNSAYDVFEKLKRDAVKLKVDYRSKDECFNFSLTAWHLYHDWIKNDIKLSRLAKNKHESSRLAMKPMMHALEVLANSNKHIKSRNNQNVIDTKYVEITDFYTYCYGGFPTIITETAEYPLWKIQELLIEYFEWIFDESENNLKLKDSLLLALETFNAP